MSSQQLYGRLVRADRRGRPAAEQQRVARNGLRQLAANGLQAVGDQVVNAKTVLPWLLSALGAPGVLIGLLVPVRESGSMLPQAWLAPVVEARVRRAPLWVLGSAGQAVSTAGMALAAAALSGPTAGLAVLGCLGLFSLARALCSLAGKDVLGRTVPAGERGQINGLVTVAGGAVAITLGLAVRSLGGAQATTPLAVLLAGGALAWVVASLVYRRVEEPVQETAGPEARRKAGAATGAGGRGDGALRQAWRLLREDQVLRRFVLVRSLLLVSALSPPFVVALAAERQDAALAGLGSFVIAQGVAALLGGRFFGRLADRSSRTLMAAGAAAASLVVLVFLAALTVPAVRDATLLYPAAYLLLVLAHTGVRVARKTYVVDIAEGDRRTDYVAVSNTAMGVLLLVAGAVSGGLTVLGTEAALGFLAGMGLLGVVLGRRLPAAGSEARA